MMENKSIHKDKAKQLFEKFIKLNNPDYKNPLVWSTAKECALICVDEVISQLKTNKTEVHTIESLLYWKKVGDQIKLI